MAKDTYWIWKTGAGGEVPENGVDGEVAEEVLVLAEDLAAQCGAGDIHQVLPASRTVPFRQCVR
jgi:hypothetical protein